MSVRVYTIIVRPSPTRKVYIASCNGQTAESDRPAHAALELAQRLYPTTAHKVRRITGVAYTLEVPVQDPAPAPEDAQWDTPAPVQDQNTTVREE